MVILSSMLVARAGGPTADSNDRVGHSDFAECWLLTEQPRWSGGRTSDRKPATLSP
jgi:hypothetical protein